MKISSFIIALILVGVVATTFTMTIIDYTDKYGVTYDNETLAVFEDTAELKTLAEGMENKTNSMNVESGILDVVGTYIGRVLDTLKFSMSSFGIFENMASMASTKLGLPSYFMTALITVVLLLVIFALFAVMVKQDV